MKNIRGISLVEVLIAISLFAFVAVASSDVLVDSTKFERKSSIADAVYYESQIMMHKLTKEIQTGTIDYEEYYNYCVIQGAGAGGDVYFGINHGVYGSRFYDPGKSLDGLATKNPKDLGLECSYPSGGGSECEVVYTLSTDLNTGQNPFYGIAGDSTAFYDNGVPGCGTTGEVDHLFLIDNTGTQKTIIARKRIGDDDWSVGLVRMRGLDIDQNGIVDTFTCLDEYDCYGTNDPTGLAANIALPYFDLIGKTTLEVVIDDVNPITVPQESTLDDIFDKSGATQFFPISPLIANIEDLQFIINPLEDPYKAFAESGAEIHPSVTIILTMGLSEEAEEAYPGDFDSITVRTTVSTGVLGRIETYPPVNEVMGGSGTGWIDNVIPGLSTPY